MKTVTMFIYVAFILSFSALADHVQIGDNLAMVKSILGEPTGYVQVGTSEVLYYNRGRIELKDDQVIEAELISEEEVRKRTEQRLIQEEEQRVAQERIRLERFEEGTKILNQKLSDPYFLNSSLSNRISFWRSFANQYPMVTLPESYLVTLREFEEEQKNRLRNAEQEQKIAALEARVKKAEQRALHAERNTRRTYVSYPTYSKRRYAPRHRTKKFKHKHSHHRKRHSVRSSGSHHHRSFHSHRRFRNKHFNSRYGRNSSSYGYASCRPRSNSFRARY